MTADNDNNKGNNNDSNKGNSSHSNEGNNSDNNVHWCVLLLVEVHRDWLHRWDVKHVVSVVKRGLLVVERREAHALEVQAVSLLTTHHDPHGAPLSHVHGLNHQRNLVDKRDGASDVVQHLDVANLLPRHWHVLQQLEHGVWHVLESSEVHPLVVTELAVAHVTVVGNDLDNTGTHGVGEMVEKDARVH